MNSGSIRTSTLLVLLILTLSPALAAPISVTITGQFPATAIGTEPPFSAPDFSISFVTDTNPVIAYSAPGEFLTNITGTFSSGSLVKTLNGTAGWYQYTPVGRGLDVRLYHFDGEAWLQTIFESGWTNPGVDLFTGGVDAPTIIIQALLSADRSQVAYYPTPSTHVFLTGLSADYTISAIPEPGTAFLLFLPLTAILGALSYTGRYGQSGNLRRCESDLEVVRATPGRPASGSA